MKINLLKIRAIRYFLAQTDVETIVVQSTVRQMLRFDAQSARELFANPFITGSKYLHVLNRMATAADEILIDGWWNYATRKGVKELAKALRGEEYERQDFVSELSLKTCYDILRANYPATNEEEDL